VKLEEVSAREHCARRLLDRWHTPALSLDGFFYVISLAVP
jgi:hypothetical protein